MVQDGTLKRAQGMSASGQADGSLEAATANGRMARSTSRRGGSKKMRPPTGAASRSLTSGMNRRGRLALTDEATAQAEGSSHQHDRKCELFHASSMTLQY